MDCVFCKISSGLIPTKILAQSNNSIAFLDAFPLTKGHVLVIPKKHYSKVQEINQEENLDLFNLVHKVLTKVDSLTGSTLVAIHNGKDAGQEIPHVHVHLVPRDTMDGAGPIHSMFDKTLKLSDAEINSLYEKLKV